MLAAVVATVVFGAGTRAHAAPPRNVGWLYTLSRSGAVFFDADLAGYPSFENITVCDNKTDGRGIESKVVQWVGDRYIEVISQDPSNNGEYWGSRRESCASAFGTAEVPHHRSMAFGVLI
ncbi:hypothetical protein [Phytohabitans aurantiacus]|uniref:Uncharacterized protein n=1 Tax=Phytohabitans aurantiacus TaxID=3016789 RepID=A0ABQ5R183_9ACTN|nr:hypothetical protein [Phytohabitans aurantiacus]GLI00569.1 hypothetical protein Pa4123_58450 [Phytohabitans aurantiacus]